MAKRFTDTDKYKKRFYRGLPCAYKLLWDYIYHDCDHAGLWIVDIEIAQLYIGSDAPITENEAINLFNKDKERVVLIENGNYWFIPSFLEFQYGSKLSKTNNIYKSIEKILTKYDLFKHIEIEITDNGETISSFRNRISRKVREKIFIENEMICQYCQEQKTISELVVDHIIPLNKNGTNDDQNLTCSCVRCNSHKTDILPWDFLEKDHAFLNPTNSLIAIIKTLKGAFKDLNSPKDKDKEKLKDKDKEIETKKINFQSEINKHTEHPKKMLDKFFEYWIETNKSKTKMRFELEKTWDLNLRLKRWAGNNFDKTEKKQPHKIDNDIQNDPNRMDWPKY